MRRINPQIMSTLCFVLLSSLMTLSFAAEKASSGSENAPDQKMQELNFYTAAKEGRLSQVKAMLSSGTNVNSKNAAGRTALMGAAYYGNRSIVKELLAEGVDVNLADEQGKTALMLAVANKRMDVVEVLLNAGADVTLADKKDKTVLIMAEKAKNKKLLKMLEAAAE